MDDGFRFADELGPTRIIHIYEPTSGLRGVLVVDNVAIGPAIGGCRMATDVSVEECFRLARAMTLKNAAAGLPHGGGKSVLLGDPRMPRPEKERLIRAFACALEGIHEYIIGPDMGTDEECMAWAMDEIGRSVGLPRELGGIPLDEIGATGWGMLHATEAALDHGALKTLEGARVVVQGFGAVGMHAVRFLSRRGAVLVAASDSRGAIRKASGLDVQALIDIKRGGGSVIDSSDGEKIGREEVIDVDCEIWIPAARPDVIRADNVARLKAKLVVEGANIPVTEEAERSLHEGGVLCLPDFIANAGGVICAAMEYQKASEKAAMETVAEKVRRNTAEVLESSRRNRCTPRVAATDLAVRRVKRAMQMRRWSVF